MNKKQVNDLTRVGVKLIVEGIHYFPEAETKAGEEVYYLRFAHRHNFGIECIVPVNRDNREKEFIMLKHEIREYLHSKYYNESIKCLDFMSMSCEQIAKDILGYFAFEAVTVDEDDENFAVVQRLEELETKEKVTEVYEKTIVSPEKEPKKRLTSIVFVMGRVCSGKNTYTSEQMKQNEEAGYRCAMIDIGQLVRCLKNQTKRQFDESLAPVLYELVSSKIDAYRYDVDIVYIVGIRQKDLFLRLRQTFSVEYLIGIHVLNVPYLVRKKRYEKEQDSLKNQGLSFDEVEKNEVALGVDSLINDLYENYYFDDNFFIIKNF